MPVYALCNYGAIQIKFTIVVGRHVVQQVTLVPLCHFVLPTSQRGTAGSPAAAAAAGGLRCPVSQETHAERSPASHEGDLKMPNVLNHQAEKHNGEEMRSDSSLRSLCNRRCFYLIY